MDQQTVEKMNNEITRLGHLPGAVRRLETFKNEAINAETDGKQKRMTQAFFEYVAEVDAREADRQRRHAEYEAKK